MFTTYRRMAVALFCAWLAASAAQAADSLRADVIALLPASVGEIAYVDLVTVRRSPHYRTIKQRVVPERFHEFEQFVRRLGINVDTDLDWLAWGLVSSRETGSEEYFFGVVQGRFDEDRVRSFYATNELPTRAYRNQILYLYGEGESGSDYGLTLLDRSTGVFGSPASLELLLDTRDGTHANLAQDRTFYDRIGEVNGRTPVWVVMNDHYTQLAIRQLLPELAKFDEFNKVASRFQAALARMNIGRDVSLKFEVECQTAADAQSFSFLLQTGLTAQGWQAQQQAPELGTVLNRADIRSVGSRLRVDMLARETELQALLAKPIKLFP